MTYREELIEKRTSSLIVVFTLGLAALFMESVRPVWMTNLFEGTSFDQGGVGFVVKMLSYLFLGVLTAGIFFIIHFFKVIYYSIEIAKQ